VIQATPLSLAIILACTLGVPLLGWWVARRTDEAQFLVAGRGLTLPAFVATLVCTWYGGILAVGEYSWSWGLVNWLALGVFYYVFAAVYALFLVGRLRRSHACSIPEEIALAHGPAAGRLAALYTLLMVSPAPYILMAALILGALSGLPLAATLALTVALTVGYVWKGGLRSVVVTDRLQFLLMFGGFALALGWLATHHGGPSTLPARLPATHLEIPGGLSWSTVVLWGFVALWTLVDPGFHQRVAVARDERTARRGIWISIACWFVFDALTTACGLYARALLPDLEQPLLAFPALSNFLPPLVQGLFVGGMLATVLSTLDSYCFLSGTTFSRDLFGRRDPAGQQARVRWGVLLTSVAGALLAWRLRSVVQMWIVFSSLAVPVLLPALLQALWRRGEGPAPAGILTPGLWGMLAAALTGGAWLVAGFRAAVDGWPVYPLGLEPLYPGLAAGLLMLGLATWRARREAWA